MEDSTDEGEHIGEVIGSWLGVGLAMELKMRLVSIPEYAPKAWIVMLPPTSKSWIFWRQITSLSVYPTIILMNMDADEYNASVKASSLM